MSKHTPGPWRLNDTSIFQDNPGDSVVMIASCAGTALTHKEHRANARLIAVSPRMLKALQKVAALYNPNRCAEDETARNIGLRMEMMEELHEEVMEIIRKAEPE